MKRFFKNLLYIHLYVLAKLVLFLKSPKIILVAWIDKKSIIRYKIVKALEEANIKVYNPKKHYNTWFGITLTILGLNSGFNKVLPWFKIYFQSWIKFLSHLVSYPKYIVLEAGIDTPWEAWKFLRLFKPNVLILTTLSHQMSNDFSHIKDVELEFVEFIKEVNKNSQIKLDLPEESTLEESIKLIIENENFALINAKDIRIKKIGEKMINKVFLEM